MRLFRKRMPFLSLLPYWAICTHLKIPSMWICIQWIQYQLALTDFDFRRLRHQSHRGNLLDVLRNAETSIWFRVMFFKWVVFAILHWDPKSWRIASPQSTTRQSHENWENSLEHPLEGHFLSSSESPEIPSTMNDSIFSQFFFWKQTEFKPDFGPNSLSSYLILPPLQPSFNKIINKIEWHYLSAQSWHQCGANLEFITITFTVHRIFGCWCLEPRNRPSQPAKKCNNMEILKYPIGFRWWQRDATKPTTNETRFFSS